MSDVQMRKFRKIRLSLSFKTQIEVNTHDLKTLLTSDV